MSKPMVETARSAVSEKDLPVTVHCVVCAAAIQLWFNGGELDERECCGHLYALEHGRIELATYRFTQRADNHGGDG